MKQLKNLLRVSILFTLVFFASCEKDVPSLPPKATEPPVATPSAKVLLFCSVSPLKMDYCKTDTSTAQNAVEPLWVQGPIDPNIYRYFANGSGSVNNGTVVPNVWSFNKAEDSLLMSGSAMRIDSLFENRIQLSYHNKNLWDNRIFKTVVRYKKQE